MSRRTVFLALGALLATILVLAATSQRSAAQSPPLTKYFSSYARAHRVTIRRNGNIVTTFDVPVGVYISVYSDQEPVRTALIRSRSGPPKRDASSFTGTSRFARSREATPSPVTALTRRS